MSFLSVVQTMNWRDTKLIRRDSLLCLMLAIPIAEAVIFRYAVPALADYASESINLIPYYPLITGYVFISILPMLYGMISGFLLLDERDEDTLTAMRVTPVPIQLFLAHRFIIPVLLSVGIIVLTVYISDLSPIPWLELIIAALLASMAAPFTALFMVAFAENKVQGFAMTKILGTIFMGPILAYFIDLPGQLILGIVPTYWAVKVYWLGLEGESIWIFALCGLLYQTCLLWYLLQRFQKTIGK